MTGHDIVERANLRGPIGQLAQNSSLREIDGESMVLALMPSHMHLAVEPLTSQMEEKVSQALGRRPAYRPSRRAAIAAATCASPVGSSGNGKVTLEATPPYHARSTSAISS